MVIGKPYAKTRTNEGTFHGRKLASVMPLLYNIAHTHRTHSSKYGFRTATGQWSNLAKKAEFLEIKMLKSRR